MYQNNIAQNGCYNRKENISDSSNIGVIVNLSINYSE
jgi:hypothetical protein